MTILRSCFDRIGQNPILTISKKKWFKIVQEFKWDFKGAKPLWFEPCPKFEFRNSNFEIGNSKSGVTLLELLIVLMIIGILVTAAVKTWDVSLQRSRFNSTIKEMEQLAWAIAGNPELISGGKRSDFGYVGDNGLLPPTLRDLYENVNNYPTWHGPYIKPAFAENPQGYMVDAWGDTYVYPNPLTLSDTQPVYIRSYGGGSASTPQTWLTKIVINRKMDLLSNPVSGDFADAFGFPPTASDTIKVTLFYPRLGRHDSFELKQFGTNSFTFTGVPVGNHKLRVIGVKCDSNFAQVETVEKYICVLPRIGATGINIRFATLKFRRP
ncbi:MAG: type II secretion system protein [candidate division WOR-3 bacterium]